MQILSPCMQPNIADTFNMLLSQSCEMMPCYVDACQFLGEQTYHTDVARDKQLNEKAG